MHNVAAKPQPHLFPVENARAFSTRHYIMHNVAALPQHHLFPLKM
jgi:hypothetical protein